MLRMENRIRPLRTKDRLEKVQPSCLQLRYSEYNLKNKDFENKPF